MRPACSPSTVSVGFICLAALFLGQHGCGGFSGPSDNTCDPNGQSCADGQVCEAFIGGESQCATPVVLRGAVIELVSGAPIEGALVQAVDANGTAVGTTGLSASDGTFSLSVPAVRDAEGNPVDGVYTLRVQAAYYQEFPTAIRPALPLDVASAELQDEGWLIESALTTIGLIRIPGDTSDLGSISGTVQADGNAGALIVASDGEEAFTSFSDSQGDYVIFNVSPGTYTVQGYAAGMQLEPAYATLEAGEDVSDVHLMQSNRPLNTISGNVQIVNAPGDAITSVVLSVESTFDEFTGRGKVPPGLRVWPVSGAFSINDIPDGRYVVLAAFENDDLVRDPDQTIGGTAVVRVELPDPTLGNEVNLPEGFKVTEALSVIRPGADRPESLANSTPTLEWEDDSSEDGYELRVFDAFGNLIWEDELGPTSGSATVAHAYAGSSLQMGMFYQFRVVSFRERSGVRTAISATEDLKGVFLYLPTQASSGRTSQQPQ